MKWENKHLKVGQGGFTIVELLIVVVVIAILAAITVVAYNGVSSSAKRSAALSELSTISKKVNMYAISNTDTFPGSLSQIGIANSGSTKFRYTANNSTTPKTFCLTAINGTSIYNMTNSGQQGEGYCPGHDIESEFATNLITNPSFENNTEGWLAYTGATIERVNENPADGSYSLKVTPDPSKYISGVEFLFDEQAVLGEVYSASVSMRSGSSLGSGAESSINLELKTGSSTNGNGGYSLTTWGSSVVSHTATTNAKLRISIVLNREELDSPYGVFYIDKVALYKGTTKPPTVGNSNYRDGNSPAWIWNGTPGNSSSTGYRH